MKTEGFFIVLVGNGDRPVPMQYGSNPPEGSQDEDVAIFPTIEAARECARTHDFAQARGYFIYEWPGDET